MPTLTNRLDSGGARACDELVGAGLARVEMRVRVDH